MLFVCSAAPVANADEPGVSFPPYVPSAAIRVWPADRHGATFVTTYVAGSRDPWAASGESRPLVLQPLPATLVVRPPPTWRPAFVSFHKIGVSDLLDAASPIDRHASLAHDTTVGTGVQSVYVIEVGHNADIVAYGKRFGVTGGEGTLHLGKRIEASGRALFSKDGQVSIVHNLDLKLGQVALNAPGLSVSPFARAGFLLDYYRVGVWRGTIVPGAGFDFTIPTGYSQPLTLGVMASPELTIEPDHGPSRLGARLMVDAEILMF